MSFPSDPEAVTGRLSSSWIEVGDGEHGDVANTARPVLSTSVRTRDVESVSPTTNPTTEEAPTEEEAVCLLFSLFYSSGICANGVC
jgi:hypothetical protein